MHICEANSIINKITDENKDIIDLTVGRVQDYPYDDAIDDTIVSEELAEEFRASLAQYRYPDASRSLLTEIVDAVCVIDF